MRNRRWIVRTAMALALGGGLAGCGGGAEPPPPAQDTAAATGAAGTEGMAGHDMGAMHMDPAVMQRHAQEMDSTVAEMRRHVQAMRQAGAAQWHARMGEHAPRVARMLSLLDRQMREMDMGMGMDDAHMGEMMGMSAEEHRRMMEEMQALRADVEQLQTASEAEVRQRMPEHLDRLERMLQWMEQSARHMHGMH
jgi:hypothetical protein